MGLGEVLQEPISEGKKWRCNNSGGGKCIFNMRTRLCEPRYYCYSDESGEGGKGSSISLLLLLSTGFGSPV